MRTKSTSKLIISFLLSLTSLLVLPYNTSHAENLNNELAIQQIQLRVAQLRLEQKNLSLSLQNQIDINSSFFTKTLELGITDDQVAQLQEFLKQFTDIYPEGFVTGYFGVLTENAVKRFQQKEDIDAIRIFFIIHQ